MTRIAWFNCAAGVAGDMVLAALIDAGADRLAVMDAWGALGVDGFAATWERVQRCGVAALWTNLAVDDTPDEHHGHEHHEHHGHEHHGHHDPDRDHHGHRPAGEVLALIAAADLDPRVASLAGEVYRTLAEVEGAIHGLDPDEVELHEVGALDSILDVVGACAALVDLGIDTVRYSPIAVGHGSVDTQHGRFPNPVPAVSRLLERGGARAVGIDTTMELSTPTGVALLTVWGDACGPMPPMQVEANGFGAGTADPPHRPNVVQVVIGTDPEAGPAGPAGRPCHQVEANVDDVTPEVLAHTVAALLDVGAHDAWVTPIVMKKGRPAHTVHALCDDATFDAVRSTMLAETGTLGLRATHVERWPQRREERCVDVDGHPVRIKVAADRVKVEHDDAAAAATALGLPLRTILDRAARLADGRAEAEGPPDPPVQRG